MAPLAVMMTIKAEAASSDARPLVVLRQPLTDAIPTLMFIACPV